MAAPANELEKISGIEIEKALQQSGYMLESRLYELFQTRKLLVLANQTYVDPSSKKEREYDLYVRNARQVGDGTGSVHQVLLIECINNQQPLVFFTKDLPLNSVFSADVKCAGLPCCTFESDNTPCGLPITLGMNQWHHYCRGGAATQYCSFKRKGNKQNSEWMATHIEEHHDVFRKLSDVVDQSMDKWIAEFDRYPRASLAIHFYYPIVVVQGDLCEARLSGGKLEVKSVDRVHYYCTRHVNGRETRDHCDVVRESAIREYLDLMSEELRQIAHRIEGQAIGFEEAIQRIKRLRGSGEHRRYMDSRNFVELSEPGRDQ